MKYIQFKNQIRAFPVFSGAHLGALVNENGRTLRNQLTLWQNQGLILRLKRNLFMLNDHDRKITPSRLFLGNQLYTPSYISLETALSFYDLIPEKTHDITSVSTKKTTRFQNDFGGFRYQHLKPDFFCGYIPIKDEAGLPVFLATPEKALADTLYLNLSLLTAGDTAFFENSLRLQNTEELKVSRLKEYTRLITNKKFRKVMRDLITFIQNSRGHHD